MITIMGKVHMGICAVQKCCRRGVMSELPRALPGTCSMCVLRLSHKHELRRGEPTGPLHRGEKLCCWMQWWCKGCLNLASCSWCGTLWSSMPVVDSSCHGWTDRNDICFFVQCWNPLVISSHFHVKSRNKILLSLKWVVRTTACMSLISINI